MKQVTMSDRKLGLRIHAIAFVLNMALLLV